MSARPVRLQLSRRKGFDLQALSHEINGLDAIVVSRPGKWGNPFDFRRSEFCWIALSFGCRGDAMGRQEASVRAFREWVAPGDGRRTKEMWRQIVVKSGRKKISIGGRAEAAAAPALEDLVASLRGKNLACWCKPGAPCHADVLLEFANKPVCEPV
jgi:hypothetical protein